MKDQKLTRRNQFEEAIKKSVETFLTTMSEEFEVPDNEQGSGSGFLNAFSREMGLNVCDYFTAYFVLAKGTIGDDNAQVIKKLNDFWANLFSQAEKRYGLEELLAQDDEFRAFLDGFIEVAVLNPYDYYTAKFILDSDSDKQSLIDEVKSFWQTTFDQEETSPSDIDMTNSASLIARLSSSQTNGDLKH